MYLIKHKLKPVCVRCGKVISLQTRNHLCSSCFGNKKKEANRICPTCGEHFYNYKGKNKVFCSWGCRRQSIRIKNIELKEKRCIGCGKTLPIISFSWVKKSENRREARCKECHLGRRSKYAPAIIRKTSEYKRKCREHRHKKKLCCDHCRLNLLAFLLINRTVIIVAKF